MKINLVNSRITNMNLFMVSSFDSQAYLYVQTPNGPLYTERGDNNQVRLQIQQATSFRNFWFFTTSTPTTTIQYSDDTYLSIQGSSVLLTAANSSMAPQQFTLEDAGVENAYYISRNGLYLTTTTLMDQFNTMILSTTTNKMNAAIIYTDFELVPPPPLV